MLSRFLLRLETVLQQIEHTLPILFGPKPPPGLLPVLTSNCQNTTNTDAPFSVQDLIGDGFLWAVPKNRATIERRMKRKYGSPYYGMKTLQPKTTLRVCSQCGHDYEVGLLCPHCYDKICKETKLMQEKIQEELRLDPVDKEVVVLYDGENGEQSKEFWNGKRIVEMKKPRPVWFSKNLMQKSTEPAATTTEVKPNDLG